MPLVSQIHLNAADYIIHSPDKHVKITVNITDSIQYSVSLDNKSLLAPSPISLTLYPDWVLGKNPKIKKVSQVSRNLTIKPTIPEKNSVIKDCYNQLELTFKGGYGLIFRAYDNGTAYRFVLSCKGDNGKIKIKNEEVRFNFNGNYNTLFPLESSFQSHQERLYEPFALADIGSDKFSSLPALTAITEGPKLLIMEADLRDYPGLYLQGTGGNGLKGIFPGYPLQEAQPKKGERGWDRNIPVTEYADYIARTDGRRSLPWRVLAIALEDKDLIHNQLVFQLAAPLQIKDTSWITPGKTAWDWWNFNNIHGVDFRAGVNTQTYKYYIDFAAKFDIDYIIMDEGWYELGDLKKINPDIDMPAILAHAAQKNVGVILWVIWKTLDQQLDETLDQFEAWGIKGIKVDFMQRDDQPMVNYYHKVAKAAAHRKLLVDFHGSYTPRGLRRAYPNVITRESVKGLENYKWKSGLGPDHEVTIPFIRMVSGPMDFTPGAMINAQETDFAPFWNRPMSKGTRTHQLAMYVVYESPLQMLADNPSHYYREPECMKFLAAVPVTWDETRCLDGKIGDYVIIARRKGKDWYIGAMTDWTARDMEIKFDFLPDNASFKMTAYTDGLNADRNGNDFSYFQQSAKQGDRLKIHLAPGGGWVAQLMQD